MLEVRDKLRHTQMKSTNEYKTLATNYMLPVNINRIINNIKNNSEKKGSVNTDAEYIIKMIDTILENKNTRLYCLTDEEMANPTCVKYLDDQMSKTAFKFALHESLGPKKSILVHKFSKEQLEEIAQEVISSFNKSIVEPGEMVGIIAAQSLGEPVTQLMLNAFHSSGVGGKGGTNIGVDRIKEVFSLSKNPKEPSMIIYLDKEHRGKKDFANKIASHIKFTTIKDLRNKIEIFYDPKPYAKGGFMEKDNIKTIFYTYQQNKQCCSNNIDGLPWLMRIEFDKEKLLNKEVSLLDIKSQFCFSWEKRYLDIKSVKREKRQLLEKISQLAVLSNTDNDDVPTIHLRFDMTNFGSSTLIDFMDMFVDEFKLKGMPNIEDVRGGGKASEERYISFDNPEKSMEKQTEYVVYTKGINMNEIRNIIGVDLNRTYCDDIIKTYEIFGIEAARNLIIREIINVLTGNGSSTNYQHISMFGDLMTSVGALTSIDRHGLNKLDTDPLSRASFEKTVDQLITAAVFNEIDHMKSVSSRIMAGLCIKGGTGLCNLIIDNELIANSEYTIDIGQLYKKTYEDITVQQKQEIDTDVFIPDI
jgi:DNA-directed RNA polymerase II subunit RPB1